MKLTECPICGAADRNSHWYPCRTVTRAGVAYTIHKDRETGLMFVLADGAKIGQTQTEAGAKLIRRNHSHAIERKIGNLG